MLRRIVTALVVLAACVAAAILTAASGDETGTIYRVEFDNAFGLTEGGDLRIGGVNAGQTIRFGICPPPPEAPPEDLVPGCVTDSEPAKALVEFEITEPGFDSLREDATCDVRQQSLIGEYLVDCQPGTSDQELPPVPDPEEESPESTIPVEQTTSIIPTDLVNNVLNEPYRERLRLILAELGAGVAGRPQDIEDTLKRAHPGLRETTKTLDILKGQTEILKNFVSDSDAVIDDLAQKRADVVRFVEEAGETAEISATRKEELAKQFRKFPGFLRELDPTMVRLGQLADAQVPLLADLRRASDELNRFFTELGPFSQESLPSLRTLGRTGDIGRRAIEESDEEIRELRRVAFKAKKAGDPLRQFLQTLDDRDRAVHEDTRVFNTDPPSFDRESLANRRNRGLPEKGFTGMEAFLNYLFWQNLTINTFDSVGHFLRVAVIFDLGEHGCSPIATSEPHKGTIKRCNSYTGPTQPGVRHATGNIGQGENAGGFDPDPTERPGEGGGLASSSTEEATPASEATGQRSAQSEAPSGESGGGAPGDGAADRAGAAALSPKGALPGETRDAIDRARRHAGRAGRQVRSQGRNVRREARDATGDRQGTGSAGGSSNHLLDFLLGP